MKIQDLAIIFVIIILPISIVLSVYTQFQIQTLNTQTLYDTKLTTATYDAIKAFQINTANSTMSDLANSKLRDIEASVDTFKNSIMTTFGLNGYTEEDLNNFIPALVYTMYDGFYIYSPYENTNHLYEYKYEDDGNGNLTLKTDSNGKPIYKQDDNGDFVPLDNNGETMYGLKPYITYSCRYKYPKDEQSPDIDVVITYSLDNYITVQGMINGSYVNKEGYLIDGIDTTGNITYNEIEIKEEALTEYVNGTLYPYAKINGTKYYYDDKRTSNSVNDDEIFYLSNGKRVVQIAASRSETITAFNNYKNTIFHNNAAIKYYRDAEIFTEWVRTNLNDLKYENAYGLVYEEQADGTWQYVEKQIFSQDSEYENLMTKPIFEENDSINIENDLSNFNLHRQEIIRHKIETNLSIAIANYNYYSLADGIEFQLPELKEDEWEFIINNVSLISFVQGLDIGGKLYNGYTIVNNSETKEVIQEENIYILGNDNYYHKIGDAYLEEDANIGGKIGGGDILPQSSGRANLDFEKKKIIGSDNSTIYYYPLKDFYASYNSIVTQNNVTTFKDIYAYIQEQKNEGNENLARAFYTALGRERYGMYKALRADQLY